jgi:hypothetical protein
MTKGRARQRKQERLKRKERWSRLVNRYSNALTRLAVPELHRDRSILRLASSQLFELEALPLQLKLIPLNLHILVCRLSLAALQLVADQRAGAEPQDTADRRARARMAHRGTNDAPCCRAAESADPGAFFPGSQAPPRAAGDKRSDYYGHAGKPYQTAKQTSRSIKPNKHSDNLLVVLDDYTQAFVYVMVEGAAVNP